MTLFARFRGANQLVLGLIQILKGAVRVKESSAENRLSCSLGCSAKIQLDFAVVVIVALVVPVSVLA